MSLVLRHEPSAANLELNGEGWAPTADLVSFIQGKYRRELASLQTDSTKPLFDLSDLKAIVAECPKQRYKLNADATLIRASQGHSLDTTTVNIGFVPLTAEELKDITLYHGTSSQYLQSITQQGLLKMSRQFVHLSGDETTAISVARRHPGKSCIFYLDVEKMLADKINIFRSDNNVYLCEHVSPQYLIFLETKTHLVQQATQQTD